MMTTIFLASQSPRRRQLLEQLGVPYELLLPDDPAAAEALEAALPGESPDAYVQRVTALKLDAALRRLVARHGGQRPVLCADTTVAVDRDILAKPAGVADAERMLRDLSGGVHRVLTAVALGHGDWRAATLSISEVRFATLAESDIAAYLASEEWRGKAGGYAIQGRAAAFIAHLSGSYSGVMGLPLFETANLLRQCQEHARATLAACSKTS